MTEAHGPAVVGVFRGPWDTGLPAKDGAVIGFEDVFLALSTAVQSGEFRLATAGIDIFPDYHRIKEFLSSCAVVYANCGPWTALLYLVRERERLNVRIIREIRTIGWVGYIWQEEVATQLERPGDQRVFPSAYARDLWAAAMPGTSRTRIYYPLIRSAASRRTMRAARPIATVGFFSALSPDKGFSSLPAAFSRMHDAGHAIDRVVLSGRQTDPDLYAEVVRQLTAMNVGVDYRGAVPHGEISDLMAGCDCILFLTTSSIESLGRVMVEASAQKVAVVTADFGAALDLVAQEYRIPVDYPAVSSGRSDTGFPLGQLALDRWSPPVVVRADACYLPAVGNYVADAQRTREILLPPRTESPPGSRPLRFTFDCEVDGLELADKLLDDLNLLRHKPIHELLDLGGTLKQYLLVNGYNPRVSFTRRDHRCPPITQHIRSG